MSALHDLATAGGGFDPILVDSENQPASLDRIVHAGENYFHVQPANIEPDVNAAIELLYEDDAIIVVNKPAPLPIHPSGRFNRNTLQAILCTVYAPQKPRPAHRLDANTTGIVVFTRTRHFAHKLQPQFERGEVEKLYLARIVGHPPEDAFVCEASIAAEPCEAGGRLIDPAGLSARTEFRVLERLPDGTSRIEAVPRTGRTNQIRVHLWHLGWPILGDPLYRVGGTLGTSQTLNVNDPPMHLHAKRLTFNHPLTGERVTFEAADFHPLPLSERVGSSAARSGERGMKPNPAEPLSRSIHCVDRPPSPSSGEGQITPGEQ